jgi:hypothetical protein
MPPPSCALPWCAKPRIEKKADGCPKHLVSYLLTAEERQRVGESFALHMVMICCILTDCHCCGCSHDASVRMTAFLRLAALAELLVHW